MCSIARAGLDYIGISSNETFDPGSLDGTVRCANITLLIGSQSNRQNLNFTVTLTTSDPDVTLRRGLTNVAIRGIIILYSLFSQILEGEIKGDPIANCLISMQETRIAIKTEKNRASLF